MLTSFHVISISVLYPLSVDDGHSLLAVSLLMIDTANFVLCTQPVLFPAALSRLLTLSNTSCFRSHDKRSI